jgi:hypothetical protein
MCGGTKERDRTPPEQAGGSRGTRDNFHQDTMASTLVDTTPEPRNALLFKEWLVSHGGSFHPGVRYLSSGTSQPVPGVVVCPFLTVTLMMIVARILLQ